MLAPERRSMPLRPGLYDLDGYLNTTFSLNEQVCGGDWLDDAGDLNTVNSLKTCPKGGAETREEILASRLFI